MRVPQILRRFLVPHLKTVHSKRREAVLDAVEVLVRCNRLSSAAMGRAVGGDVRSKHNIKKIDRLLGNKKLHQDLVIVFAALAQVVLKVPSPLVLVDWTRLNNGFGGLCASVPIGGRSLPIYFEVHPMTKWHNKAVHDEFLNQLDKFIVPAWCKPIIVADAGFQVPWFREVIKRGWHFLGNLNPTLMASREDEETWAYISGFHEQARYKPKSLGQYFISKMRPLRARLILFKPRPKGRKGPPAHKRAHVAAAARKKAKSACILATTLTTWSAKTILALYRTRMQIEESFRDAKSHRFGWALDEARSKSKNRWSVLLMLASLGMLALNIIGIIAEQKGLHRGEQANTIRHRRVLSTFTLGRILTGRGEADFLLADILDALHTIMRALAAQPDPQRCAE